MNSAPDKCHVVMPSTPDASVLLPVNPIPLYAISDHHVEILSINVCILGINSEILNGLVTTSS